MLNSQTCRCWWHAGGHRVALALSCLAHCSVLPMLKERSPSYFSRETRRRRVAGQVACEAKLRDKWLPLVWSRRTERRLFLPHAEVRVGPCVVAWSLFARSCRQRSAESRTACSRSRFPISLRSVGVSIFHPTMHVRWERSTHVGTS